MRVSKWIVLASLAVGLVGAGVFGTVPKASAQTSPHGGYAPDTAACAVCHRAHTAVGPILLTEASVTELCYSCHGNALDALNVREGSTSGGAGLAGGGFETAPKLTPSGTSAPPSWILTNIGVATHGIGEEGVTAWGGAKSGAGVVGDLECTSCHNPHGSTNFRDLKDASNGFPATDGQCGGVPGCAAKAHRWMQSDETLNWVSNQVVPVLPAVPDSTPGDNAYYTGLVRMGSGSSAPPVTTLGMNAFCAACHKQYLTKSGAYDVPSSTGEGEIWNVADSCSDGSDNDGDGLVDGADSGCQVASCSDTVDNDGGDGVDAADPSCANLADVLDHYVYPGTQDAQDGEGDIARYRHAVLHSSGSPQSPLRRGAVGSIATGEGGGLPTNCADNTDNDGDTNKDLADSECAISYGGTPTYTAMTCLTCHFAHGSAAAAAGAAAGVAPTNDNALLYYDNRGVCRSCHQKDK